MLTYFIGSRITQILSDVINLYLFNAQHETVEIFVQF